MISTNICGDFYTPLYNKVERGKYRFHLVLLSVCLSIHIITKISYWVITRRGCKEVTYTMEMKIYLQTWIYLIWRRQKTRKKNHSWKHNLWRRSSACEQNCVCSVSSTIQAGSMSYLHFLLTNFRWYVTCWVFVEIWIFGNFFEFVSLTLFCVHVMWMLKLMVFLT